MADITFRYEEMERAAGEIDTLAGEYASAASTLQSDFAAAVSSWEGDTKEKLQGFVDGAVTEYTGKTVPDILKSLAELLRANAKQMQDADRQIAENIPSSLQ